MADYRVTTESGYEQFTSDLDTLVDLAAYYRTIGTPFTTYRSNPTTGRWVEIGRYPNNEE